MKIHINQLGYKANSTPKKAIIPQSTPTTSPLTFEIICTKTNKPVFRGECGEAIYDTASASMVRVADFSDFNEHGEFFVRAGSDTSYTFAINDEPYKGLRAALLEMFNYQKCGVAIDCGVWSHPPCHDSLATVYGTDRRLDVSGGWHDAGDYGRYIVPAAKAVADLLLAHELAPDKNLLETVWFEIEWFLKMQCKKTGGVYHKVSCRSFNAMHEKPHEEKGELVISPMSLTATANFVATMAMAARFYPERRERLLSAAWRAWLWCRENSGMRGFVNPPGISTGPYGDKNPNDELFWAACELFGATGSEKVHGYAKNRIYLGLGWANVGTYGIIAYLRNPNASSAIAAKMKSRLWLECERIMKNFAREPYGTSLNNFFRWGSNLDVANNAMHLLLYDRLVERRADYRNAAMEHMHYLLGRNPLSKSYISGFGTDSLQNPHLRTTVAAGATFPGLVTGGPNANAIRTNDAAWKKHCLGKPPSMCYVDDSDSYSTNEITIYWNSPVYFLASVLGM
ncbi:MAG: glycoside hydrolase family 9 protein [Defluviitaleaceae bacterium]|nr:glycoside hydrolase family 9 protein [Defluviitaleaceae bacterium]